MIRVNLLAGPRAARPVAKQLGLQAEAGGGIGAIVLALGLCFYYSSVLDSEIEAKQFEKQEKEKRLASLKEKVKQVEDFEQKKKLLEDKNRIIDQLENARGGPVRVMDHVSQSLEPLRLWLAKFSVKGKEVELEGKALTNDDVVEFANNLRRTDHFTNIRLVETRSGTEAKVNLYQFRLNLSLKG